MGLTWIFGYFLLIPYNVTYQTTMQWLFTIFNAFQVSFSVLLSKGLFKYDITLFFSLGCRYSINCQGTSTRRQRRDFFGLRVKLPPVNHQSKHSLVEAIPLSALPKDTTSELAGYLHTIPFKFKC